MGLKGSFSWLQHSFVKCPFSPHSTHAFRLPTSIYVWMTPFLVVLCCGKTHIRKENQGEGAVDPKYTASRH